MTEERHQPALDVDAIEDDGPDDALVVAVNAQPAFTIDSPEAANWLVRKVIEWRNYRQRMDDWHLLERRRAERNEAFLLARFGDQLRRWASQEIQKLKGRSKSVNLPAGRVGFRLEGPKLVVDDETTVINWAREQVPAAVDVVLKLKKSVVNEHFSETGEIPPGTHVEEATDRFFVR